MPSRRAEQDWSGSGAYYGSRVRAGPREYSGIIVRKMTIIRAEYSGDHRDVAIISDRHGQPNVAALQNALGPNEGLYKTLLLGPEVAIGMAGDGRLCNLILAEALGLPESQEPSLISSLVSGEDRLFLSFPDAAHAFEQAASVVVARKRPPLAVDSTAILVGRLNGRPVIAELSRTTKWRFVHVMERPAYCIPEGMTDSDLLLYKSYVTRPGLDYIASLKAAVEFCADRYESVNHRYVLRCLKDGFRREEGEVPQGASLPSS
ncbi:MAG: hypothetical protein PHU43_00115 [Candidatus Bipolaricaulis sp.]|nr:hypothetical protein [Candidatus Bipolaricaulis sp.]